MIARCICVAYVERVYERIQGVKKHSIGYRYTDRTFRYLGNGHGVHITPSCLLLSLEVGGKEFKVDIAQFFKENIGKLSASRRHLIIRTMPEEIEVSDTCQPLEKDLQAWLERFHLASKEQARENRRAAVERRANQSAQEALQTELEVFEEKWLLQLRRLRLERAIEQGYKIGHFQFDYENGQWKCMQEIDGKTIVYVPDRYIQCPEFEPGRPALFKENFVIASYEDRDIISVIFAKLYDFRRPEDRDIVSQALLAD